MKKNIIITYKENNILRGAYFIAKRLAENYSNLIEYTEKNIFNRKNYNKIIFNYQSPIKYNINIKDLIKYQDIIFIREEYNNILYNSFTNGFYYWKSNKSIKSYIPIITFDNNLINKNKNYDEPIIGIYFNPAYDWEHKFYLNFIKNNLSYKYIILGYNINYKNIINTFDNKYFFNNITHFLYAPDKYKQSPFPNTLLEAVLSNTIPIILGRKERKIKDGVDDMCECINYLDIFNLNKYIDNSNTILSPKNLDKFYKNNLYNFNGFVNKNKYKYFKDLLEEII